MEKEQFISITDANKNFSKISKLCKEKGELYILKNNKPEFVLKCISSNIGSTANEIEITDDEKLEIACKRILNKYHKAFEELAK